MTKAERDLLIALALTVREIAMPEYQRDIDKKLQAMQDEADSPISSLDD